MDNDRVLFDALNKRLNADKTSDMEECFCQFVDEELGTIFVSPKGKIIGDNIKISECNYNYEIPVLFRGIEDFNIEYFDDVKNQLDISKYIKSLKSLLNSKDIVKSKIIEAVLTFYESTGFNDCTNIHISAYAHIQEDIVDISVSCAFYISNDEEDAYIDLEFDCSTGVIKQIDGGFY